MNRSERNHAASALGLSRRNFLLGSLSATLGAGLLGRRWGSAAPRSITLAAPNSDYRALVCVYLVGGNDSYNFLVPSTGSAYDAYADARANLALPAGDLLPVGLVGNPAQEMGFHPRLPKLRQRFLSGDLGVVANVGTLNAPTTAADVLAKAPHLPPHLFSHSDQSRFWQGRQAQGSEASGWGAGLIELLAGEAGESSLPPAISLGGANPWQTGGNTSPYGIGPGGSVAYLGFDGEGLGPARKQVFDQLIAGGSGRVLADAFAERHRRSLEFGDVVAGALADAPSAPGPLPADNELAEKLDAIARLASQHTSLGAARQIFFVRMHGFDTHTGHLANQPELFRQLDDALSSFQDTLDGFGLADCVTTFTASDFGRSLTSNGKGCDHGWGGHQFVLGGAVTGGAAYGTWPTLALASPEDVGFGRLLPTTAVDQMSATLASWMGVAPASLPMLFPNLSTFSSSNLGFLPA